MSASASGMPYGRCRLGLGARAPTSRRWPGLAAGKFAIGFSSSCLPTRSTSCLDHTTETADEYVSGGEGGLKPGTAVGEPRMGRAWSSH